MWNRLYRVHATTHQGPHNLVISEAIFVIFLALLMLTSPVSAAMRFQERSLYMNDIEPGATTSYTIKFRYMTLASVGSVDMLFCIDPIPYHECVAPEGLDVSGVELVAQLGEDGFSIRSKSPNHIVLSRDPELITASSPSSYKFDGMVNPTGTDQSFSIRLRSHSTQDASGPQIDFGSIKGQVTEGIVLQTQVPPMLIFCVAEQVADDCSTTNDNYYADMGNLSHDETLAAQSQMSVGTNASSGFVITTNSVPMSAGLNVIDFIDTLSPSSQGVNQFGINLVANDYPVVGHNPEGPWTNAVVADGYDQPNMYKYVPGDVLAHSPNVSLMRKFTVSYIVNSEANLAPGVYSTTVNYITSGRF